MPTPEGFERKVFESRNGFNDFSRWQTSGKTITAVNPLTSEHSSGFCLAMTCRWLQLSLQQGIDGSARVMDGRELLNISMVHSAYRKSHQRATRPEEVKEAHQLVYEQFGIKRQWRKKPGSHLLRRRRSLSRAGFVHEQVHRVGISFRAEFRALPVQLCQAHAAL